MKKLITVVTPCYREEQNVTLLAEAVKQVFEKFRDKYEYEHIFIDNASDDQTVEVLKKLTTQDRHLKIIVNQRNFGHIRSPYYGLLQAQGDAVILLAADFQDPPKLIDRFIEKWEEGYQMVIGIKTTAEESKVMFGIRSAYYYIVEQLSTVSMNQNHTGFGLYDKVVIQNLRKINDPYPYFRGLISELGFTSFKISYNQPLRKFGVTKNNFYSLYDIAMLGITNHSKVPLRIATMLGFVLSACSLFIAFAYLIAKLMFWYSFTIGIAPVIISIFFFGSVQLFFIGIIGEYIGAIHTQVQNRPLVVEKERIGFN